MTNITPCLWFDTQAHEAAEYYTSVFPNSRIVDVSYYGDAVPGKSGTVLTVEFELDGTRFVGLNGGPQYAFNPAISFQIDCATQEEVDHYWNALTDGGAEDHCGWVQDRFGMSWQVVPRRLTELLRDPDTELAQRVMEAMLQMRKIDIAALEDAAAGAAV